MEIYLLFVLLLVYLYYQLTKSKNYFRNKPIPTLPRKLLFGSTAPLMLRQISFAGFIEYIYNAFPSAKILGMFDIITPVFVVRDPELIKQIGVRDFEHFMDHVPVFGVNEYEHPNLLVARTLIFLNSSRWKNMRATLSPAFTGSKMRQMYELVVECSENAVEHYLDETRTGGPQVYEMKNIFARFANDVIATYAFGIQINASKDPDTEFYRMGRDMMNFKKVSSMLKIIGFRVCPMVMARLGIDFIDEQYNTYFKSLILTTIKERETKGIVRRDMIHQLIQAKNGQLKTLQQEKDLDEGFATVQEANIGTAQKTLSDTEMVAQCLIFFLAGFESVSTNLLFLTYELAINPEVQKKLHAEVMETHASLGGKSLNYDAMQRMKYMDMVVTEALRKWPPVPALDRVCVKDYQLDDGNGLSFKIDKGTALWIPTRAIHHDPKYYPNPEQFDPERFSDERKDNINPSTYLPFGIGPRNCIGSRFALAMVKTIVYYLLLNFSLERTAKTEVPLVLAKGFVEVIPENGVHLEFRPRV